MTAVHEHDHGPSSTSSGRSAVDVHATAAAAPPAAERGRLGRRAQLLARASVAYDGVEAPAQQDCGAW